MQCVALTVTLLENVELCVTEECSIASAVLKENSTYIRTYN